MQFEWMSKDQLDCYNMLCDLFGGEHHVKTSRVKEWGNGIAYTYWGELATFDFDELTRLVLLAHYRCIRVAIGAASPRDIRLILHKRNSREGKMWERHPTMEDVMSHVGKLIATREG